LNKIYHNLLYSLPQNMTVSSLLCSSFSSYKN